MRQQSKGLNWRGDGVILFLDVQTDVSGNPSFCICIQLQGKHFCAFYQCSAWDHYICNSLCSLSAPIGLNIREVSPQVWMNLWPFAKHTEILLLRIIIESTSLQGEEEITGANFFAKPQHENSGHPGSLSCSDHWVSSMFQRFPVQMDLAIRNTYTQTGSLLPLLKQRDAKTLSMTTDNLVPNLWTARFPLETQVNHFPFSWHSTMSCSLRRWPCYYWLPSLTLIIIISLIG